MANPDFFFRFRDANPLFKIKINKADVMEMLVALLLITGLLLLGRYEKDQAVSPSIQHMK